MDTNAAKDRATDAATDAATDEAKDMAASVIAERLPELVALGRPVMVGTSRKSFIGKLTGREIEGRTPGTLATNVIAYERGARLFRVHDVGPTLDALTVTAATLAG